MPRKPKRPCGVNGCPNLTEGSLCDIHKPLAEKRYNKYNRDESSKKFYSSKQWRNLRKQKLNYCPFCEECMQRGIIVKANTVDHIIPKKQGGASLELSNLQSLCRECHSRKSAKEGSRWGSATPK